MKLVKELKVTRFPKSTRTVKQAFQRAQDFAQKEGWTRVIIIGEGKNGGHDVFSKMHRSQSMGMLESSKYLCLKEWFK